MSHEQFIPLSPMTKQFASSKGCRFLVFFSAGSWWEGAPRLQQHSVGFFLRHPVQPTNGEGKIAHLCFLHVLVLEVGASIHQGKQCISLTPAREKMLIIGCVLWRQNCIFSEIIGWCLLPHLKHRPFLLTSENLEAAIVIAVFPSLVKCSRFAPSWPKEGKVLVGDKAKRLVCRH